MNQSVKVDDPLDSNLMNNVITHTGSTEIEGVSDVVRQELAAILHNTALPVVIRIGDRKCLVLLLPPDAQSERLSANLSEEGPGLKRTILTRREREAVGEAIDIRFRTIQREQPQLASYLIYARLSEESVTLLGHKYGPREIEGRHHRYQAFMEKRRRRNSSI